MALFGGVSLLIRVITHAEVNVALAVAVTLIGLVCTSGLWILDRRRKRSGVSVPGGS
jgi:hypothetical protein